MNPVHANQDLEVQDDLDKPRNTVYKNTWRVHKIHFFWCNLKLAQRKGEEFPPQICAFQQFFRCVAGATVQSSCLFTATVDEQLFDKFLSVFRGLVFLHSAFSSSHPIQHETEHICCLAQTTRSQTDLHC